MATDYVYVSRELDSLMNLSQQRIDREYPGCWFSQLAVH